MRALIVVLVMAVVLSWVPSLFAQSDPSHCGTGDYGDFRPPCPSPDRIGDKAGRDSEMRGAEAAIEEEKRQERERREERREHLEQRPPSQIPCDQTPAGQIFGCHN